MSTSSNNQNNNNDLQGFDDVSGLQHTLAAPVKCSGVALHSGEMVEMTIRPALENTGIVFVRDDAPEGKNHIKASYNTVVETTLGTTIANEHGVHVATIEHLMAALWGYGIDNAFIHMQGPEIPIMDGSSEPFYFLLECTGRVAQAATRVRLKLLKPVSVTEGDSTATAVPADGFTLDISIAYDHPMLQKQRTSYDFSVTSFKQSLARARTFGFMRDVEKMHEAGLARGGSFNNAIVLSDEGVLNAEGLRYNDEFIRHKALDCVGDFLLAGAQIEANITTFKPGHGINNALLHAIFADSTNYRLCGAEPALVPLSAELQAMNSPAAHAA